MHGLSAIAEFRVLLISVMSLAREVHMCSQHAVSQRTIAHIGSLFDQLVTK